MRIRIKEGLLKDVWAIVLVAPLEISWFAGTEISNGTLSVVPPIIVPEQRVSPAYFELTDKGVCEMYNSLDISRGVYWGHSHVRMSVFASSVDAKQTMRFFSEFGAPSVLRGIYNKMGKVLMSWHTPDTSGKKIKCPKSTTTLAHIKKWEKVVVEKSSRDQ